VRIQVQGFVDAAFERLLHDEVERAQAGLRSGAIDQHGDVARRISN
jgi:hypothetical protein